MSSRINMYGFSLARMRRLFRSRDEGAARRIRDRLAAEHPDWRPDERRDVGEVVERAIMEGVPFPGLGVESHTHSLAARVLAGHEQEWLPTHASIYHVSAVEGLWRRFGRRARPEVRAFLRGLVEGVPLFGQQPPGGESTYAAVSLEKLRSFQPGLADLLAQVAYRVGRMTPNPGDEGPVEFASGLCDWVDQIVEAGRDLWFTVG
jgi:hypothetical protein